MASTEYFTTSSLYSLRNWINTAKNLLEIGQCDGINLRNKAIGEHWNKKVFLSINPRYIELQVPHQNLYWGVVFTAVPKYRDSITKMLKSLFITAPVILVETADTCYTYKKWESKMKLLTRELS